MDLKNKIVVVTGGSDGIGRHICLKLAAQGAQVALLGRDVERLARVEQEARAAGAPKAAGIVCDLQDVAQINAAITKIQTDFGGIDILINNAGIWHKAGPLDTISPEMLEATVQTNLTGLMQMTQAALPAIRAADEGAILNVISKSGVVAQGGNRSIPPQNMVHGASPRC